jgi:hypothetical protein
MLLSVINYVCILQSIWQLLINSTQSSQRRGYFLMTPLLAYPPPPIATYRQMEAVQYSKPWILGKRQKRWSWQGKCELHLCNSYALQAGQTQSCYILTTVKSKKKWQKTKPNLPSMAIRSPSWLPFAQSQSTKHEDHHDTSVSDAENHRKQATWASK